MLLTEVPKSSSKGKEKIQETRINVQECYSDDSLESCNKVSIENEEYTIEYKQMDEEELNDEFHAMNKKGLVARQSVRLYQEGPVQTYHKATWMRTFQEEELVPSLKRLVSGQHVNSKLSPDWGRTYVVKKAHEGSADQFIDHEDRQPEWWLDVAPLLIS